MGVPRGRTGGSRFLVLGLRSGEAADVTAPPGRGELIACGPLPSDDEDTWPGTAALGRAPDPQTARAAPTSHRYADTEVHSRQSGGRPS